MSHYMNLVQLPVNICSSSVHTCCRKCYICSYYDGDFISFIRIWDISLHTYVNVCISNFPWQQETLVVQFLAMYFWNMAGHFISLVIVNQWWNMVGFKSPRCPKAFISYNLKQFETKVLLPLPMCSYFPTEFWGSS